MCFCCSALYFSSKKNENRGENRKPETGKLTCAWWLNGNQDCFEAITVRKCLCFKYLQKLWTFGD